MIRPGMLFTFAKHLEHGVTNPIVARLTLQTLQILEKCNMSKELREQIAGLYVSSLVKQLLRCWEIEQRLRADFEKAVASYKPVLGASVVELPQIPRLEEECRNYLAEARNFLRELLQVFNLLYSTKFSEASEWVRRAKKQDSVQDFAKANFGENDLKTMFLKQMPPCNGPFIDMRNAAEHPGGYSGELRIKNFSIGADGKLQEPTWTREKDGKIEYGPFPILLDMQIGVHNLLISGESIPVMWALQNLMLPNVAGIAVIPEQNRDPKCSIKYTTTLSPAFAQKLAQASKTQ